MINGEYWVLIVALVLAVTGGVAESLILGQLAFTTVRAHLGFVAWILFPYFVEAGIVLVMFKKGRPILDVLIAILISAVVVIYVLINALFLHRDPQAPIVIVFIPFVQGAVFLAVWAISRGGRATIVRRRSR